MSTTNKTCNAYMSEKSIMKIERVVAITNCITMIVREMLVTQESLDTKVRKGKQGLQEPRAYK